MVLPRFARRFFTSEERLSTIGAGAIGGKAHGLAEARSALTSKLDVSRFAPIAVDVPRLAVIATDVFDAFVERNRLRELALSGASDVHIAGAFQRGELPAEIVGDLWGLAREVRAPLAVRSSSLLEDALRHPFAGVYLTKMTPNNQFDPESRFRKLTEAVKLVYASTFFRAARAYVEAAGRDPSEEKMAVILQEVVGRRHGPRFYPDVSGVARSYNFYPVGDARPQDGACSLALGLGKTIVDGGRCWTYSPARPAAAPPVAEVGELLDQGQAEFWAVNMGTAAYDPLAETEYLARASLGDAEADGSLRLTASTYDPRSDRLVVGTAPAGPRLLNFAPLLVQEALPLNALVQALLRLAEEAAGVEVEIEFALSIAADARSARLGFLQVRPTAAADAPVEVAPDALAAPGALVSAVRCVGNGTLDDVRDVVLVKPETFELRESRAVAAELDELNRALRAGGRPYVLVGFGRWGSSDPWLGVPVQWAQISGARAIVEAPLPKGHAEPSQGAHFFHNLVSFGVLYLCVTPGAPAGIDWDGLGQLVTRSETRFVRHLESPRPLTVKVDGRSGRGVVLRSPA